MERGERLLGDQRRGGHAVDVDLVGHEAVVGRIGNLAAGIGPVVPPRPVEDVRAGTAVVGRQRDGGSGGGRERHVQVAARGVRDGRVERQLADPRPDPARSVDRRREGGKIENGLRSGVFESQARQHGRRSRQGRDRQRPVGQDTGVARRVVADAERPRSVGIFPVESAQGFLGSQRRGRDAVGVGLVRDEAGVAGVGDLPERIGLRVPDRSVEDVGVRPAVLARQGDDGPGGRGQRDRELGVEGVSEVRDGADVPEVGARPGDRDRGRGDGVVEDSDGSSGPENRGRRTPPHSGGPGGTVARSPADGLRASAIKAREKAELGGADVGSSCADRRETSALYALGAPADVTQRTRPLRTEPLRG